MIAYATADYVRAALPDAFGTTATTDYDAALRMLAERASREIDALCGRRFYPELATRYLPGSGTRQLYVEELLAVDSIAMSGDDGATHTYTLAADDYFTLGGARAEYGHTPICRIDMNVNSLGDYGHWYRGQRSVKIVGTWGWHDDYAFAWEDSGDTVENAPLTAAGTSITVNDADGVDAWGATPRFSAGQLLRIGSEYAQVTVVTAAATNTLTVRRGILGTTAAEHAQDTAIYVYQAPAMVKQAVVIQAARWFKRGQQAYQDVSASAEMGQLTYAQKLDPDIATMLYAAGLRRVTV